MAVAEASDPGTSRAGAGIGRLRRLPRSFVSGFLLLAFVTTTALLGPLLLNQDPNELYLDQRLLPPSSEHWFGTDNYGRDVLLRIIYGASIDLAFGFFSVIPTLIVGTLLGIIAGMSRRFDAVLMRILELVIAFPFYVLVIAIVAALGPGMLNMYIAVFIIGWASYARLVRNEVLVVISLPYVAAARLLGFSRRRIVISHILPNVAVQPVVMATTNFIAWILLASALGFLGLGVQPPTPEWGVMIAEGREFLARAPWISVFPGIAILITCSGALLLGDGLADLLRPEVSRK